MYTGIAYAGVHDSYWTHAGTVDDMNRILREQFVQLHSRPLLQNLLDEFRTNPAYVEGPSTARGPRASRARHMPTVQSFLGAVQMQMEQSEPLDKEDVVATAAQPKEEAPSSQDLPDREPDQGEEQPRRIEFPEVPPLGDLDINVVKDSTYFFA